MVSQPALAAPIRTTAGLLEGVHEGSIIAYKGVPYAAPPVGELRWRSPQPARPWSGVRKADTFGPACAQAPGPATGGAPTSEDCLYLNIWRPADAKGSLPIMVFLHGGFSSGYSAVPTLWGDKLAKKGVIAVTIDYRVGVFGFLALPALSKESGSGSGGYALMDVIAGLKWIKANARALGGDPARVTLYGQSAGSYMVSALVASQAARGLFSRAIGESDGLFAPYPAFGSAIPLAQAEKEDTAWIKSLGMTSLADLRKLPAEKLVKAPHRWWPVVDGKVLTKDPYVTFAEGRQADIPMLVGNNANEGVFFLGPNPPLKAAKWSAEIAAQPKPVAKLIRALYPFKTDEQAYWSSADFNSDIGYDWQIWTWARLQSRTGKAPIRMWRLEQPWPAADPAVRKLMGTPHGAEIFYVMGHFDSMGGRMAWSTDDRKLGDVMASYWTNFAKTGNPNGPGLPEWPAYHEGKPTVLLLKSKPEVAVDPRERQMQAIDAFMSAVRAEKAH